MFFQPEDSYLPKLTLDDIEDKIGKDKEIKRENTRLPTEFYTEFLKNSQPKKAMISELDVTEDQLKDGVFKRGHTPSVKGYKLVKKAGVDIEDLKSSQKFDPVIAMHKLKNYLEKGEKNTNSRENKMSGGFRIPETSQRELLSHRMVQKTESKKKRTEKETYKKRLETLERIVGTPSRTPSRKRKGYDGLSDAAKRLAGSVRKGSGIRPMSILKSSGRANRISDKITPNVFRK